MKKYFLSLFFVLFFALSTFAQEGGGIDMATGLRSSGKIYVVVLGLLLVFFVFIFYLFTLDRKITRIEKKVENRS